MIDKATTERKLKAPLSGRKSVPKKTAHACNYCHQAHMTCDDSRPCKRCIQRNLADSCRDAPRKKKKYLMDIPDEVADPSAQQLTPDAVMGPSPSTMTLSQSNAFMSSAADLEYSILGNIIHQDSGEFVGTDGTVISPSISTSDDNSHITPLAHYNGAIQGPAVYTKSPLNFEGSYAMTPIQRRTDINEIQPDLLRSEPSSNDTFGSTLHGEEPSCDSSTNQYFIGPSFSSDGRAQTLTFPYVVSQIERTKRYNPKGFRRRNKKSAISFSVGLMTDESSDKRDESITGLVYHEPSEIYSKIKRPYSYPQYYHSLILYLRKRFDKESLVAMSKAMAEYRPSFIAGTMNLKEDDLIFTEQCFQRTLLEYDNYISISGTPTVVWRRTSQLAYVGSEFCVLTGWSKEQLLGRSTFIVEILDDKSVLDYFELFSKIAFGDFRGATMTECTLLTPDGKKIRTSSIWTLKRDVFGIPMMVIANFLPILT
ncbi:Transcriptional regulator of nonfermentable carbon utilization [Komagataella kurtzmanii]|nr:Transcriptional regulator of nonfermentable carbon utilization [Komagataella kurtzmanii]